MTAAQLGRWRVYVHMFMVQIYEEGVLRLKAFFSLFS